MTRPARALRRALRLAAALAVAPAVLAPALPAAAQEGTAPRRLLAAHEQLDFRGVGRLDMGAAYCTATLFDASHALTAAHCLFDDRGQPRRTADLWFRAGLRDGGAQAVRQVRRYAVHPNYRWNGPRAAFEEIAADVAMIELDQPLLTSDFPSYDPGDLPSPGGAVALLSYGAGRDRALSLQEPCRVTGRQGPVAALDCEVGPGSSGSPVLVRDAGGALRLAGVISAKGRGGSYASAASETLPLLRWAMDKQQIRRAAARPETADGLGPSTRAGGWKTSRPPEE
ncbi:trypsin-like serine protease [Albimonas sp. CAU 1670]|uniref:trypsin-like serine peptidase n=1 Tax=Albimonas sp. CAU 1670 TaxID=3032599 RepID=UPI0023DBC653|nr:trypsin-like serine protease [Albimonas sp. CAU 1670]MDF2234636.1 trypsin-like serine protease [Albimonas sp. CAU 1670]